MNEQELHLAASHSNWRLFMVRKADPAFLTFQNKVFLRDNYTCQYCGFRAKQYMDVVNANADFRQNAISNLMTSCCFCSQCFFLESVGRDEIGGGSLIIMPEMQQTELNALCHSLFVAIVCGSPTASQARNIYRQLKLRSQKTEKSLGKGMSKPSLLGRLLVDCDEKEASKIKQQLSQQGLRLLPDLQRFAAPVKAWILESLTDLQKL